MSELTNEGVALKSVMVHKGLGMEVQWTNDGMVLKSPLIDKGLLMEAGL